MSRTDEQPARVDVLTPAADSRRDPRERIRNSRFGTLIVLLVTAAVIAAGAWLVRQGTAQDAAAQIGGATVITLPGVWTCPRPRWASRRPTSPSPPTTGGR